MSLATRLNMTPTQQAASTQGLIAESGGVVSMVAASYATADHSRCNVVGEIASKVQDDWVPPKLCTALGRKGDIHSTSTLTNHCFTEKRLTVIVGDAIQLKLLGVPLQGPVMWRNHCRSSWVMTKWTLNMTFDTTRSNRPIRPTGDLTAAFISIQDKLQRAVLWSGIMCSQIWRSKHQSHQMSHCSQGFEETGVDTTQFLWGSSICPADHDMQAWRWRKLMWSP